MNLLKKLAILFMLGLAMAATANTLDQRLTALFGSDNQEDDTILEPDAAFKVTARLADDRSLVLRWDIADGYYLYRDQFKIEATGSTTRLGTLAIPAGILKQDEVFGSVYVHYGQLIVTAPVTAMPTSAKELGFRVSYQGCKEGAVCYPPIEKRFNLALATTTYIEPQSATGSNPRGKINQDSIAERLRDSNLILNLFSFFIFGLLLSFTPCIFPMIPILSGVIIGQGNNLSTSRAFVLSASFVLAMACTYALLGMIAGSFNINLQAASQHAAAIITFSVVFVLLALAMFGFYELRLPSMIQDRLTAMAARQQGGSIKGVAAMGTLSAIIVGPCVAPPLAGALLYISQTGDALLGGAALFFMGLGFGVPLLIVGTSAGKLLPKAGQWMHTIRCIFGVLMLAVAIWLLERVFATTITLMLWATLFIISAVYMGALEQATAARWGLFKKGLGLVILIYGAVLIIGAVSGGEGVTTPLKRIHTAAPTAQPFTIIKDETALDRALTEAQQANRPVMLEFYARWCAVCKRLERSSFLDARVQRLFAKFVLLKIDVSKNSDVDQILLRRFELFGPPGLIFFDRHGQERASYRLLGFIEAGPLAAHLTEVIAL